MAATCPVSRSTFLSKATAIVARVGDLLTDTLTPKEFSTGSFGYHTNGKVVMIIDGKPVKFTANIQLVAIGSKEA